jgi:glycosyltransferase involved in cell wall biosynthesis
MSYTFSVVIPTLNEEKFLPKLLRDLVKQKEKNFEVIIVDGKSEDKTKEKALTFKEKLSLKILIANKRNVSYQRNEGGNAAKGRYIIFLDADSRINFTFLSQIKKVIDEHKYLLMIPALEPISRFYQDKLMFKLINYGIDVSQNFGKPFSSAGNFIIQKNLFEHIGGFDEKLFIAEDHEILHRARKCGVITKFLKDISVQYSLRRVQKDGMFDVARKYSIALFHILSNKKMEKQIFEYEMGGGRYVAGDGQTKQDKQVRDIFKQFKKQIEEFTATE